MNKNINLKGFHLLSMIIIAVLLGYYVGVNEIHTEWKNYTPIVRVESKSPPGSQALDMTLFNTILDKVNRDYYNKEKIDSQKMLYGAISGMLSSLDDPYTSFFPPKENESFKTQLAGEFSGIGAELDLSPDKRIMVVSPLDGSPAQKAGIRNKDLILKVDDKDTNGWTVQQAVENIRGPKGSEVKLVVLHENEKSPKQLKITRDTIVVKSVNGWLKDVSCAGQACKEEKSCPSCSSVAYIRLSQFGDKTNDEWTETVTKLAGQIKDKKNFRGIILDLRNNPGGYLTDAVFIASEFLKDGVVVMQENNTQERKPMTVDSKKAGLFTDSSKYKVVVLVNGGSASASEIVAGALADHDRATLVGENTFGKGTIQEAVDVGNGASVHVSVAKWLTPLGTWVNKKGIEPDVKVEYKNVENPKAGEIERDNQLQKAIEVLMQ